MLSASTSARKFAFRPDRRLVLAALALGGLGATLTVAYLGRGPAPITVTDVSGGATFNFRVTGIPMPGKIEGVTPNLTFSPRDLASTQGCSPSTSRSSTPASSCATSTPGTTSA